jgi:hypothetical protein
LKNILVQKVDALLTLIIANDGQRFFCLIWNALVTIFSDDRLTFLPCMYTYICVCVCLFTDKCLHRPFLSSSTRLTDQLKVSTVKKSVVKKPARPFISSFSCVHTLCH